MADHTATPPADFGSAGDDTIVVPINDSEAGGTYYQPFERVYTGDADGTPVYIYVPLGALDGVEGVHSLDPSFDHNPDDEFVPCETADPADYVLTQEQINRLGDELAGQIVRVDEDHFGPMDAANPDDPSSDSLVTLVYNVQDENYYDCAVDTYTAGYFASEFALPDSLGMNVITLDAFDWANRIGEDPSDELWDDGDPSNDRPELYEGVIAHELEHLLMNYSDAGELSWVDEGLADMAAFLNGYDMTGSHLTYQQVFHRETSLTRWGGGLENYGASFSYFAYLWEQAGGNGGTGAGALTPDLDNDQVAGDELIQLIFEEQADGMEGVQNAIDTYNDNNGDAEDLRTAEELFQDWVVTMYLDDEGSNRFDLLNFDLGAASGGWTIDLANDEFFDDRGNYRGRQPEAKWDRLNTRPASTALPFGASYEKFKNAGRYVSLEFDGDDSEQVAPLEGTTHWWGGYTSASDTILGADVTGDVGGQTLTFWNWHFIEEGWDYGFVEALVDGEWVTVPLTDAAGATVTTTDDPHGNNEEGNGITGTSGGEYFVDEPEYVEYSATLPAGTTDVQFRYSTDAAYLDTGWFIDTAAINGDALTLAPEGAGWIETTGIQNNNWTVQVISNCDLTPGGTSSTGTEIVDNVGNFVYRYEGDQISTDTFDTRCVNGNQADFVVAVSNLPTGDLTVLDADYDYDVVTHKKP